MRIRGLILPLALLLAVSGGAFAQTSTTTVATTGDVYSPASVEYDFDFSTIPTASFAIQGKLGPGMIAGAATVGLAFTSGSVDYGAEGSIVRNGAATGSFINIALSVEGGIGVAFAYSGALSLFGFGGGTPGTAAADLAHDVVRMKDGVLSATASDSASALSTTGMDYDLLFQVSAQVNTFNSSYQTQVGISAETNNQFTGVLQFQASVGLGYAIGIQKTFGF